jgi:5-methylcytosine-specific restriction endonuclease McrA
MSADVANREPAAKTCSKCGQSYSSKHCKPCRAAYQREWLKKNPEKARAIDLANREKFREKIAKRAAEWYKNNPERAKESRRNYRQENAEKKRAMDRAYYLANKERTHARQNAWRRANPEGGRLNLLNRRARVRENGGKLSRDLPDRLLVVQKGKCACCRCDLSSSGYHLDHIVPLIKGGANVDSNIQLLCPSCNHSKGGRDPVEFMQARGFLL